MSKKLTTKSDGGYYAIKGFTYQFDKSLLEVLNNRTNDIEIEQIQDIGIKNYYIQVKHKESQKYTHSKVRPAIVQLIHSFLNDRNSSFLLYCFFKDKTPEQKKLTAVELDQILGSEKDAFTQDDKNVFLAHFVLQFADNFEAQFKNLIKEIKSGFGLKNEEEATVYHAIFRANLLEVATKKNSTQRTINFQNLKALATKNEKIIFELAYCHYLKNSRYLTYLRKEYFTFKRINIPNKERLFIIEIDGLVKDNDILQIITNIKTRYFKKDTSPAPYICLLGIDKERAISLKQKLWDKGLVFADGTHFAGDRFRVMDLVADTSNGHPIASLKLLSLDQVPTLLKKKTIDETFAFLTSTDGEWRTKVKQFKEFYVSHTRDIIKIIQ